MLSLLLSKPLPAALQGRQQNPINGSDSESYAMAKIILACRGEGHWGSREEDNSKIDMAFSAKHPWYEGERLVILSQVKSGPTYGEPLKSGFKLKGVAKKEAIKTSHEICLAWVDRDANEIYWAYVHPTTTTRPQEYGAYHRVTPAMIYDLARCANHKRAGNTGGRGIIISQRTGASLAARRKLVHAAYLAFGRILCPSIGEIELTRLGWRHMLRKSRQRSNKAASMNLIPHLKKLLSQSPSQHAITEHRTFCSNGYAYRVCEHLMKYDQVKVLDASKSSALDAVAHIRVVEEIRYPENWECNVMLSQLVERRVVLRSAYLKNKM
ncbi:hypothetical protein [Cupriavidus pauculus]|uniref:DUF4365 domain-containing protein n=1 Tax=Cupriavidus pauculus TaxID=82633 RepID=A0A2N5C3I4_9BURK|nr:hypothetical protein [Cupriavidus pauculus]PLP96789.1 hypothetical protein CYJ10_30900 [Cupriavidus pauculus]